MFYEIAPSIPFKLSLIHIFMLNIILFGAPGSGKGTQSEKLIERYGLKHISTGELCRDVYKRQV